MTPADAKARALEGAKTLMLRSELWREKLAMEPKAAGDANARAFRAIRAALDLLDSLAAENAKLKEGRTT